MYSSFSINAISLIITVVLFSVFNFTYENINLKGTRPQNMPRLSKRRGKNNSHNGSRGINDHDVCILAAIDENDNMLLKISGLGHENFDKLNRFASYFEKKSSITSDSKPSITNFALANGMNSDVIPVIACKKRYKTDKGNSLSSVNQLHQEVEILKYRKRGVSTRHLPGYLNWIIFQKNIRYHYEARNRKAEAYMKMIGRSKSLINPDICKIIMPVDLYKAYGEYRYGIFTNGNPYPEGLYEETGLISKNYA